MHVDVITYCIQTVKERYAKRKMEMQTCELVDIADWRRIWFYLRLNLGRVDGWGIHLNKDKVNIYYNV